MMPAGVTAPVEHRKALALLVAVLIVTAALLFVFLPRTLVVPTIFHPTIQSAIEDARAGDIVFVRRGYYTELFTIDKPLSLIGENRIDTIIERPSQDRRPYAIQISADRVIVSGFTIKGGSIWVETGLDHHPTGCRIIGNNIIDGSGIVTIGGEDLTISGNNITGNLFGISLSTSNSIISRNYVAENGHAGIAIDGCSNVTVSGNVITRNAVDEVLSDYGGLLLFRDGRFDVYGNNISGNKVGVQFGIFCSNTTVHNNYVEGNEFGIMLRNYEIGENDTFGWGNVVYRNNMVGNSQNAFADPDLLYGPVIEGSENGTDQVFWHSGGLGNYWSDFSSKHPEAMEVNGSDVWDTPYVIDANNTDPFPRVLPYELKGPKLRQDSFPAFLQVAAVVAITAMAAVVGFVLWKKRKSSVDLVKKS